MQGQTDIGLIFQQNQRKIISNSPNSRLVNSDRMPLAARIDSTQKANIISTWSHRVQKCEILWVQRSWTQIFREIFEDPVGISGPIANSGWLTSPCKISQCAYCSAKRGRGKKLLCNAGEVIGDTECLHGKLLTTGKSAWKLFFCGITRWGSRWVQWQFHIQNVGLYLSAMAMFDRLKN